VTDELDKDIGEVALACEATDDRHFGQRQAAIGHDFSGFYEAPLQQITVWRLSGTALEGLTERRGRHADHSGQVPELQVLGKIGFDMSK
jgi:hypothetical protein